MPTTDQMLADQAIVYGDFPTETITIDGTDYTCQVLNHLNDGYLVEGGFAIQRDITVAISRSDLATAPRVGIQVTFRSVQRRISDVNEDDLQAPMQITLKSITDER